MFYRSGLHKLPQPRLWSKPPDSMFRGQELLNMLIGYDPEEALLYYGSLFMSFKNSPFVLVASLLSANMVPLLPSAICTTARTLAQTFNKP